MAEQEKTYETDYRIVSIKTIDGSTVQGKVNIAPNQRVSDLLSLNKGPFLTVVDASFQESKGKTLFINKAHIVWIEPED
ncbi:hypothetical protein Dvar_84280 [Desulfosarcina variabilis str. Montpellier]|uniref:DUF6812 domain-containing protein n=1 Tax=Desulfosarcina variabilis TaxID=2300 RepID=UPI003AFA1C48